MSGKPSFVKRDWSHIVSEAALVRARYSLLVDDPTTSQEMGLLPKKLTYADVEVRSSRLLTQSTSENVVKAGCLA